MRVVVVGGTGNVGTSVLASLAADPSIEEVVAVARRPARLEDGRTTFVSADVTRDELTPIFRGASAVVHLAWLIQPSRKQSLLHDVNVAGSARVARAVLEAHVPVFVCASSVGAYSPGPKDRTVDESWETNGIASSLYSRQKVAVERQLDQLERDAPALRVVRMRPALIFKREAGSQIHALFAGRLVPRRLVDPRLIPFVPDVRGLRFQVVHSDDVGDAYRRAVTADVRGAFNLAADPPIGPAELAELLHARRLRLSPRLLRAGAAVTYALRLQPTEPGWVDMGLGVPLLDTTRAATELGWRPQHTATDTLRDLFDGIRAGASATTPPLAR